ncbi:hypothetical protein D9756_008369 [Leucocoprinus leucothites]|uniref:Uncharacterized protein n=1 Tax=Leucocoprinus leucothites TaxID=201217 RepID=A0A8H5D059_9AGAR|nr:hypothetical protein D9756_008369 [Leucoagaricus leucothites]
MLLRRVEYTQHHLSDTMALFRQLIDRLYHVDHYHIVLGGERSAGKTTLLYLLKEGKIVTTIPTITLNREIVSPPTISRDGTVQTARNVEIDMWDMSPPTSSAGRSAFSYSLQTYAERGDALVWIIDSTDRRWLKDAVELLRDALERVDKDEPSVQKSKRRPLLVLANKQDCPDAMSLDEIRTAFGPVLINRSSLCGILPTSFIRGLTVEGGIPQAFDRMRAAIESSRQRLKEVDTMIAQAAPPSLHPDHSPGLEELNVWFSRLKDDTSPEELLLQFKDGSLLKWDHYLKIRVIFHVLRKYGREEGEKIILKGLEALEKQRSNTGTAVHLTMTYFWIHLVHFGILNTSFPSSVAVSEGAEPEMRPGDFIRLLGAYPYLVNDKLWKDYYSEGLMDSQDAKSGMVLPDKKNLPNFIARGQVSASIGAS